MGDLPYAKIQSLSNSISIRGNLPSKNRLEYGKEADKRFEVFHQISLTIILKIKWFYHVSNEEDLRRANIKSIETFISAARLCWHGHVVRMSNERLQNFLLNWRPNYEKRSRSKPHKNWNACVMTNLYWRMWQSFRAWITSTMTLLKL